MISFCTNLSQKNALQYKGVRIYDTLPPNRLSLETYYRYICKRYFRIDQHLAWHFVKYNGPLPFYAFKQIPLSAIQWYPPIRKQGWNFSQL